MKPSLTAIIIAKNEEEMIANCIETVRWCDEILVINNDSSDATVGIAHRLGARVVTLPGSFADLRNEGLKRIKTDWVLYIDADERVTPSLAEEIKQEIEHSSAVAFALTRTNILYGHHMKHGGWQNDSVVRLFKKEALKGWRGLVHEEAVLESSSDQEIKVLHHPLIHFTHRNLISGLLKTAQWTPIEAKLLHEAGTPPVTLLTLLRKGGMELWRRVVMQGGYKDGLAGWIEALVQAMNRMLVYMQLWELQQKPSLQEQYSRHEQAIVKLWKQQS